MSTETQERIFEPFYTTKDPGKGTGLGLATVFGIVKQHQGNIWVLSQPNQGAIFQVYLPQSNPKPKLALPPPTEAPTLNRQGTILVLEDETLTRNLLSDALRSQGYHVLAAATPSEGLEIAYSYQQPIYLLLTDIILPEMNGWAFYQRFIEVHPQSQVLYMSGYSNDIIGRHGVLEDGIQFLQKPFSIEKLLERVDKILHGI
jgi:CheY-like chemotaxis protein